MKAHAFEVIFFEYSKIPIAGYSGCAGVFIGFSVDIVFSGGCGNLIGFFSVAVVGIGKEYEGIELRVYFFPRTIVYFKVSCFWPLSFYVLISIAQAIVKRYPTI